MSSLQLRPAVLCRGPLLAVVAAVLLSSSAEAQRRNEFPRRPIEDDALPLVFTARPPASVLGRSVQVVGMHPEFVRVFYSGETFDIPNERVGSLQIAGTSWSYKPDTMSFEEFVVEMSNERQHHGRFGAEGRVEEVQATLDAGHGAVKPPPPPPEVKTPVVAPPTLPGSSTAAAPPPVALPQSIPDAPAAAEAEQPFNVPDWVKYLAAGAAVFVVIQFFRN